MKYFGLFNIFVILIYLVLFSCDGRNKEITKLRIKYLPEYTDVMVPVTCESIDYTLTFRESKVISDKKFLASFRKELEGLKINQKRSDSIDIRIKVLIDYSNKTDTLCLGEFFDTLINSELMVDNPKLLDLAKSKIYR